MYIGPWQEYKLAQVIKVKNDIYEGKSQRLNTQALSLHDQSHSIAQKSHISTPSTRSFSSEPIQKSYPKFDIDIYYEQWKKVESIISKSDNPSKKPPLPKQLVRKRQGKSIQEKRVNKMRVLYGIENKSIGTKNEDKNNVLEKISLEEKKIVEEKKLLEEKTILDLNRKIEENKKISEESKIGVSMPICMKSPKIVEKKNFAEKIRNDIRSSGKDYRFINEDIGEVKEKKTFAEKFREDVRKNETSEVKSMDINSKVNNGCGISSEKRTEKPKSPDKYSKFTTSLHNIQESDAIEESLNQENIDGLLQWVDNLPDDLSSSRMSNSRGFVL